MGVVVGVGAFFYASALAAFQMGGSCKEFGFTVPDWNCRQASYYNGFGILTFIVGVVATVVSFVPRRR